MRRQTIVCRLMILLVTPPTYTNLLKTATAHDECPIVDAGDDIDQHIPLGVG